MDENIWIFSLLSTDQSEKLEEQISSLDDKVTDLEAENEALKADKEQLEMKLKVGHVEAIWSNESMLIYHIFLEFWFNAI